MKTPETIQGIIQAKNIHLSHFSKKSYQFNDTPLQMTYQNNTQGKHQTDHPKKHLNKKSEKN